MAITHDRYFLDNVAKWILELDRGKGIPWEGNYSSWLDQKKNRLAQEEKTESARQRALQRELEWVRMAPRARQAKSKSRIQKYEELAAEDTGEKVLQQEITIPPPPRLGNDVVIAKGLKKAYGDKVLFDDLTFSLPRGGIVGVIGPNGAGKTTTFRLILGEEKPDGGELKVGETVTLAYVDQGYTGEIAADAAAAEGIALHVVKLPEAKRGFVLLPRRWVVERSFAWATRCRRLVKDYERYATTLAGFHVIAFVGYMLKQAAELMRSA